MGVAIEDIGCCYTPTFELAVDEPESIDNTRNTTVY
jgi:hypothetical protein